MFSVGSLLSFVHIISSTKTSIKCMILFAIFIYIFFCPGTSEYIGGEYKCDNLDLFFNCLGVRGNFEAVKFDCQFNSSNSNFESLRLNLTYSLVPGFPNQAPNCPYLAPALSHLSPSLINLTHASTYFALPWY